MKKKILLGLGAVTAVGAPITIVVSCGSENDESLSVSKTVDADITVLTVTTDHINLEEITKELESQIDEDVMFLKVNIELTENGSFTEEGETIECQKGTYDQGYTTFMKGREGEEIFSGIMNSFPPLELGQIDSNFELSSHDDNGVKNIEITLVKEININDHINEISQEIGDSSQFKISIQGNNAILNANNERHALINRHNYEGSVQNVASDSNINELIIDSLPNIYQTNQEITQ